MSPWLGRLAALANKGTRCPRLVSGATVWPQRWSCFCALEQAGRRVSMWWHAQIWNSYQKDEIEFERVYDMCEFLWLVCWNLGHVTITHSLWHHDKRPFLHHTASLFCVWRHASLVIIKSWRLPVPSSPNPHSAVPPCSISRSSITTLPMMPPSMNHPTFPTMRRISESRWASPCSSHLHSWPPTSPE